MTAFMCSLASGSLGNALLVSSAKTRVLVDMGISRRRAKGRWKLTVSDER